VFFLGRKFWKNKSPSLNLTNIAIFLGKILPNLLKFEERKHPRKRKEKNN